MRPSVFVRTQYWYAGGVPVASNFHTGSCRQYGNAKLKNNWKPPRTYLALCLSLSLVGARTSLLELKPPSTALFDEVALVR